MTSPFPSPTELGLPYPTWRVGQRTAIRHALHASTPHVVINAPTGSGKSIIASALPRLAPERRHVILTATKGLMDQYRQPFPFLTDLRGAGNYRCRAAVDEMKEWFPIRRRDRVMCDDGPCHVGESCTLKEDGCEYFDAKRAFIASQSGLTNYSAWLANRRAGQGLGSADMLVCDEAHALPEQLMSAYGVDVPMFLFDGKVAPRGYKEWQRWAVQQLDQLAKTSDEERSGAKREQLSRGLKLLATMDETWAWDVGDRGYRFEPTIPRLLLPLLQTFDGTSRVVYLSATITPATLEMLDVPEQDITYCTLPSSFPVARRPIYVVPGVRNDYRSMKHEGNRDRLAELIEDYCELYDDRRGIIHSVSFSRAEEIYSAAMGYAYGGRMILHKRGVTASAFLCQFAQAGPTAIAVSPSLMTGFNFPYRAAEFQLVVKLPFPNTQSSIMKARIRSTPRYRDHHTMTHLVQACGRINRAEDDQGETVILDSHMGWWYRDNRDLAPDWFDEAIVQTRRRISPLPRLT